MGPPPEPGQFDVGDEGGITIGGTLTYEGSKEGQVRLDFLRTDGDGPPHLLHVEKLDAVGAFSVRAPANTGPVTIVAFVDEEDDGPDSSDPAGLVQLAIEEAAIADLNIAISDTPDLGALTPGSGPPAGAEASGAAPEEPEIVPPPSMPDAAEPPPSANEAETTGTQAEENQAAAAPSEPVENTETADSE